MAANERRICDKFPDLDTDLMDLFQRVTIMHGSSGDHPVVERYSVCRCLYYKHSVNMNANFGQFRKSFVLKKTVDWICLRTSDSEPVKR